MTTTTAAAHHDAATIPARIAALQVLLCALWGVGQIASKLGNAGISPVFQAGIRSAGAALLVLAWIRLRRIPMHWGDGTVPLGVFIGVLFGLEFVCLYIALEYTTAARATILLYTAPFMVAVGAHWFVPNDRLTARKAAGLLAAFAGVVVAFFDRIAMPDGHALLGDLLCLGAAFFWAGTTVVVKATRLRSVSPEKNLLYQLLVSGVLLFSVSALLGERGVFAPTPLIWGVLAYQVFVIASVTYLTWFWLVSKFRASALSTFTFLTPVFGVFFAWLLLGEPISAALLASVALIAFGIVMVNRA